MHILTRTLRLLGSIGEFSMLVERCCDSLHWSFSAHVGRRSGLCQVLWTGNTHNRCYGGQAARSGRRDGSQASAIRFCH